MESILSNTHAHLVHLCALNGLNLEAVRKEAGVSHQVLSGWKKADPYTIKTLAKLIEEIERQSGFDRPELVNGGKIDLISGTEVNVFDPKPEMFLIEDIAEGCAYQYRWSGHSKSKITVAEHCIRVSLRCQNSPMAGLLHDATEGIGLHDIATPIKSGMPEYKRVEDSVMRVIAEKFGFEYPLNDEVKNADRAELQREWHSLVHIPGAFVMSPEEAKESFLEYYNFYATL